MKKQPVFMALAILALTMLVPGAFAQTASVKGTIIDQQGKPLDGATMQLVNKDNGKKYELKTDAKGEFSSLGIVPGPYKAAIISKDNISLATFETTVQAGIENTINFNLKTMQAEQQKGLTEAQKEALRKNEEAKKENANIKEINAMMTEAANKQSAGDFEGAVATMKQASQAGSKYDLVWFKLGEAERTAAAKSSDANQKTQEYKEAVEAYQKAISMLPANAKPETAGTYYNNLGEAYAKSGDTQNAVNAYTKAADVDKTNAGKYYFNEGAVLTNVNKVDDANAAFDKAIAADPNRAEAYYFKGINLIGKATLKGDKMDAPPGTAEAFNKYLELQPTGQYAEPAKQMLASMGAQVETSYGKSKKAPKK